MKSIMLIVRNVYMARPPVAESSAVLTERTV
jgi:hypothetical protein